jgi:hypothetical protein
LALYGSFDPFIHDRQEELTVIFSGLLTGATILLWLATRELFQGTERTAGQQFRAYVFITEIVIDIDGVDGPSAIMTIQNWGQTPAYNTSMIMSARTRWGQEIRNFLPAKETPTTSKANLGPGQPAKASLPLVDILTQHGLEALRTGELELYVFGTLKYRDAFGGKQETKFRFMMGGIHKWLSDNRLVVCEDGNEAT